MKYLGIFIFLLAAWPGNAQTHSLDEYISSARDRSPILRTYQAQIQNIQIDSAILRAALHTQVNFLSNDLYAPVIKGYGYDPAITNIAQLSALVQVSKNFLSRPAIAAQYRSLALQSQALRDTIQLAERDIYRSITDQYITAYGNMLVMNYSHDLFELLKNEVEAMKKLAQASVIKQTEFLAFDIIKQQQELTFLQAQVQYNSDYLTLNYMAGINDTAIHFLQEPVLMDSLPHDFYSSVFYKRFVTDSLRIENERRLINYSYKPTIGTFADGGYNSSLQDLPYKNFGFSAGVNIKVPIYDGHQKRLKYTKLDIEERNRVYNKQYFVNQYNMQVAQLTRQLSGTEQLFQKIRTQVDYTKTLITAYGKLLQTGDVKVSEYVTAITNYLNAQNVFRQNLISRLRIMNQINYWNR